MTEEELRLLAHKLITEGCYHPEAVALARSVWNLIKERDELRKRVTTLEHEASYLRSKDS